MTDRDLPRTAANALSRRQFAVLATMSGLTALSGCGAPPNFSVPSEARAGTIASVRVGDGSGPSDRLAERTVYIDGEPAGETDERGRFSFVVPADVDELTVAVEDENYENDRWSSTVTVLSRSEEVWFDTATIGTAGSSLQYDPYRTDGYDDPTVGLFEPYTTFDHEHREFLPRLVEEWEHRADRTIVSLRDDLTWEDGTALDAADVAFQWDVLLDAGHVATDVVTDVTATDDYEVAFHYESGTNRGVVEHAILHERADHPPQDWQPVHDGEVEPDELDLAEPTASGPLSLTRRTDEFHQFEPRPDHPAADNYNWDGYRLWSSVDPGAPSGVLRHENLDGVYGVWAADSPVDANGVGRTVVPAPSHYGLWFNHDRAPFDSRAVRRAFAYALDQASLLEKMGDGLRRPERQTGLAASAADEWLAQSTLAAFEQYEHDADLAAELLQDAGTDATEIEATVLVRGGRQDRTLLANAVTEQFDDLGWTVEFESTRDAYPDRLERGEFDLVVDEYGSHPRYFHPYYALRAVLAGDDGTLSDVTSYAADGVVTVDGDEIDLAAELAALRSTTDESEQRAVTRRLARVVNEDLPFVHLGQNVARFVVDSDWLLPEDSPHLRTRWPAWQLPAVDASMAALDEDGLLKATNDAWTD